MAGSGDGGFWRWRVLDGIRGIHDHVDISNGDGAGAGALRFRLRRLLGSLEIQSEKLVRQRDHTGREDRLGKTSL
jgi:hypothetical protein